MSFNAFASLGAAAGADNVDLFQAFQAGPVTGRSTHRALLARNDSVPTVNMFLDGDEGQEYAASVVSACQDKTVYALQCTKGPSRNRATCAPDAAVATLTVNPSTFIFSSSTKTHTAGYDVTATVQEACSLQGTTAAVCSATIGGSVDKTSTAVSTTVTNNGTNYFRYDVAITGGAEKTASPTACASGAGSLSTRTVALWGLFGAIGVAGLLGC